MPRYFAPRVPTPGGEDPWGCVHVQSARNQGTNSVQTRHYQRLALVIPSPISIRSFRMNSPADAIALGERKAKQATRRGRAMSHELDFSNGRFSMFAAGDTPWHGLGVVVQDAQTSADAIRLANLDWRVALRPAWVTDAYGQAQDTHHFGVTREDTGNVLGVVGNQYRPVQNAECFDFFDALVGEELAMFHTAGALKGGREVWILAKLPGEYLVGQDDRIEPYVLLHTSHDGSAALSMLPTSVRVVCNNTLRLAMGQGRKQGAGIKIRHTANLKARVNDARAKLGIVRKRFETFTADATRLTTVQVNRQQARDYFCQVIGGAALETMIEQSEELDASASPLDAMLNRQSSAKRLDAAFSQRDKQALAAMIAIYDNPRNTTDGARGTAWGAYNAVSEWVDHNRPTRGRNFNARRENRFSSVLTGSGDAMKQAAFSAALALAN